MYQNYSSNKWWEFLFLSSFSFSKEGKDVHGESTHPISRLKRLIEGCGWLDVEG